MSETATADSAVDQARAKANEAGTQARDRVREQVDRRSTQAGEQAGSAAQALRQASDQLRQDGNEPVARGMEQVAQRVESAGSWLRDSDGDRILREVEDFGRRNPLAVVAGGIALGFEPHRQWARRRAAAQPHARHPAVGHHRLERARSVKWDLTT
jgi:hypothetical protein